MLTLLIGPKGSGKSHVGRVLERRFGVKFFHVEPLWMEVYAEARAAGREATIAEGISRIRPLIAQWLRDGGEVCVETTGASKEILEGLLSLSPRPQTLVVRLCAPLPLCLERIAARDPGQQIAVDVDEIRRIHELSSRAEIPADLVIENVALSDNDIAARFEPFLGSDSPGRF